MGITTEQLHNLLGPYFGEDIEQVIGMIRLNAKQPVIMTIEKGTDGVRPFILHWKFKVNND